MNPLLTCSSETTVFRAPLAPNKETPLPSSSLHLFCSLTFFLDDGTLIGRREDLQREFDILTTEGLDLGLHLNPTKSLVLCGDALPPDIDLVDPLRQAFNC